MEVNDQVIDKLSNLARLTFDGPAREAIRKDLEKMIDFASKLNELDTADVEPLVYMTDEPLELRKDVAGGDLGQNEALKNAPSRDSDYFKVPKVLHK